MQAPPPRAQARGPPPSRPLRCALHQRGIYYPFIMFAVEEEEGEGEGTRLQCAGAQAVEEAGRGRHGGTAEAKAGLGLQQSQGQDLVDQLVNDAPPRETRYRSPSRCLLAP